MKLQAEIKGRISEVEIKRDGEIVRALIDGREYKLIATELESGAMLLKNDSRVYEVFVSRPENAGEPIRVNVRGTEIEINIIDPKRLRGSVSEHSYSGGLAEIRTAMPGKVVRILTVVGDQVREGDGVIVVEAMKMQNE